MAGGTWTTAEAKAKLSELIDRARTEGPQRITKNGREAVVVVSEQAWRDASLDKRSAADVLWPASVRGLLTDEEMEAMLARDPDVGRDIEF